MRKTELVHLHSLCACLRAELAERRGRRPGAFESYERVGVGPAQIQHGKAAHREAVVELLDCVTERIGADDETPTAGDENDPTTRDVQ